MWPCSFFALLGRNAVNVVCRQKQRAKNHVPNAGYFRPLPNAGYFRPLPNDGYLPGSYAPGKMFSACKDRALLGVDLLRLIQLEALAPVTAEETGFFGNFYTGAESLQP